MESALESVMECVIHTHIQCTHSDIKCALESDMESDADSIKACVHPHTCHLYCSIVTMTSAKVGRQKRYIARINADSRKREEFLMRDRLRKKR